MLTTNEKMILNSTALKKLAGAAMNDAGGDAGLEKGSDSGTIKTTNAITSVLQGVTQSEKSETDNIDPTPVNGPDVIPDGKKVVLGVFLDDNQDVKCDTGMLVDNDSDHAAYFPDYDPEELVAIGYVLFENDTGSDFEIGKTDIEDSDITYTISDVRKVMPGQKIG